MRPLLTTVVAGRARQRVDVVASGQIRSRIERSNVAWSPRKVGSPDQALEDHVADDRNPVLPVKKITCPGV